MVDNRFDGRQVRKFRNIRARLGSDCLLITREMVAVQLLKTVASALPVEIEAVSAVTSQAGSGIAGVDVSRAMSLAGFEFELTVGRACLLAFIQSGWGGEAG